MESDDSHLHGKVVALELMVRSLLTAMTCEHSKPLTRAKELKASFLASLQNVDRALGEYEDRVWASASDQVRSTFDQVIQRIEYRQSRGELPQDSE